MKNLKTILGTLLIMLLLLSSCNESDEISDQDCDGEAICSIATAQEFKNIRETALNNITQNFEFDAADGSVTLTTEKGVEIIINTNCLTKNGNAVTGSIDLEYVEIFDKGNMLITNKPTMGIMPNGDKALLITGGEFFIEATHNGDVLDISCQMRLKIPGALTGGTDSDMIMWDGIIDEDGELTWEEVDVKNGNGTDDRNNNVFVEGSNYYAFIGNFGWSNVDKFYNDARPKTTILASVPEDYDNTNCAIYLSYDGEDAGLARLDTYKPLTGLFSEHYGQIPIGLQCHAIFVSEVNGNWKYAVKSVTIVANAIITFTNSEMALATDAELTTIINGLP